MAQGTQPCIRWGPDPPLEGAVLRGKGQKVKGKGFPYSIPSDGPGADPGVQAVSPQMTVSHPPGGRLPLLSARPCGYLPSRRATDRGT